MRPSLIRLRPVDGSTEACVLGTRRARRRAPPERLIPMPARPACRRRIFHEEPILKAFALAAASIAAAALLAGCASSSKSSSSNKNDFVYLLDRHSNWVENKVDTLPPLPSDRNLLPFDVSQNTPLQFYIDAASLSVGSDGVVRYSVVVTSPSGARNINYEGIRCDNYTWRQYASLNETHDGWDRTVLSDWMRIENGNLNAYQAALYTDYFCDNRLPAGKGPEIVQNMRRNRTLQNQDMH
jgi:hypothetical protein